MPTIAQILSDIDLRYRNSFTTAQKLVWMNEENRELFDILEIDSLPYSFSTVEGIEFYPFPDEFDFTKIKTVTIQTGQESFSELPFKRNDDNQYGGAIWYTIVSNAMFINYPNLQSDMKVYIYLDSSPLDITVDTLNYPAELPVKYQEILKLGVLKRITGARKDIEFQNNFDMSREQKIADVLWNRKLKEPEFTQPNDMMSHAGWGGYWWGRV